MDIKELPTGKSVPELRLSHWPTRFQAFIWRNWELVEADTLAHILGTDTPTVEQLATNMGLRVPAVVGKHWRERGYVTLIRRNWHLLPYEQLLELLGWSADKLAYTLKEDDFLWIKLGQCKPDCEPVRYRSLSAEEIEATAQLRTTIEKHFPEIQATHEEKAFSFLTDLPEVTGTKSGTKRGFGLRLAYAYSALYGDALLDAKLDPYPEVHLSRLRDCGINGIWLPGLLYKLYPWKRAGKLSDGWETRLANLQQLVERARKYDIGVYLYLNEPRSMGNDFFAANKDWPGGVRDAEAELTSLCTSNKETMEYLHDAVEFVFEKIDGLAGVFTITMSENLTHCKSRVGGEECERCADRSCAELVAEVNNVIEDAIHGVRPDARVLLYTWAWWPRGDELEEIVSRLADNVELMCVSEWGKPTNVGGVSNSIIDYSISQVGPSDEALRCWELGRARGMKTVAKVQLNNSWECSALPWLPVPRLVDQHLRNLEQAGIDGLMVSWTLGGYPGGNMRLLDMTLDEWGEDMFGSMWGEAQAGCEMLSCAFEEFPFDVNTLYMAPQNCGPMNLLYREATGYDASMVCYPYDDLRGWRTLYPEDVFEEQFRKLSEGWLAGLEILEDAAEKVTEDKREQVAEFMRMGRAGYCHFRSTYLQIAFVRRRNNAGERDRVTAILDEEIELAKELEAIVRVDCRVGFEATNHYAYTVNDLREKVLNCEHLKRKYEGGS
ncbi:MAG: hypothetical protein JW936_07380 [Sedimentisphaerales bacterium]|nr:hypothetical protein [Sedimentisphaerales bacterium]